MKTVMNKVKMAVIATSLLASCVTMAESGEGRNGPDKNGVSIPASMDQRLITLESLTKAKARCDNVQNKKLLSQLIRVPYEEIVGDGPYDKIVGDDADDFRDVALISPTKQVLYVFFQSIDTKNKQLPPWMSFLQPDKSIHFDQYITIVNKPNYYPLGVNSGFRNQNIDQARFDLVLAKLKHKETSWKFKIDLVYNLNLQFLSSESYSVCGEKYGGCAPYTESKFYQNTLVKSFEVQGSGMLTPKDNENDFPGLTGLSGTEFNQCMQDHM